MWPEQKTAVVLFHGIGEQRPFETLDPFLQTFWSVLEALNPGSTIEGSHRLRQAEGWIESYLSLNPPDSVPGPPIDFYEYYWANLMEGAISFREVVNWLVKTSAGARKFYAENRAIVEKYEARRDSAFKNGEFVTDWYLRLVGWPVRIISGVVIPPIPYVDRLVHMLLDEASKFIVQVVGDIAIYTTSDERASYFRVRQQILDGAVAQAKWLLANYDRIIFAGHSLGTVVAYDTLNRLNLQMNAGSLDETLASRIVGLVTFGSPLDKIAFYFREHTPDDQYIRRQILAQLHGFRTRDLNLKANPRELAPPGEALLDHVHWLNFWNERDPVSGELDFYRDVENIVVSTEESRPDKAHGSYFSYRPMFEKICETFLSADLPAIVLRSTP